MVVLVLGLTIIIERLFIEQPSIIIFVWSKNKNFQGIEFFISSLFVPIPIDGKINLNFYQHIAVLSPLNFSDLSKVNSGNI